MERTALLLIFATLILLVVIVGLLTILIYKLFRDKKSPINSSTEIVHPEINKADLHPAILERIKDLEKIKPKRLDHLCPNHADEPGETVCAICDKLYCKTCIKPFKSMHFCKDHLPLMMRFDWDEVLTIKTSTDDPEQGVRLYDIKKEIFENENIPTYIETHYKINVDQDYIETYLVLFSQKELTKTVRDKIQDKV